MSTDTFDTALHNRAMAHVTIDHNEHNKRARDCRRCGGGIPKGTGILMRYWSNGRAAVTYLCEPCTTATENTLGGGAA